MTDVSPIRVGLFVLDDDHLQLIAGMCDGCKKPHFPVAETCPYCGGHAQRRLLGPDGTVSLCTIVSKPPPGYRGPVPYGFGIVRLDGSELEIVTRIRSAALPLVQPGTVGRLMPETVPDPDGSPAITWTFEVAG